MSDCYCDGGGTIRHTHNDNICTGGHWPSCTDRLWTDEDVERGVEEIGYVEGLGVRTDFVVRDILGAVLPAIRKRWLNELADEVQGHEDDGRYEPGDYFNGFRSAIDGTASLLRRKAEEK